MLLIIHIQTKDSFSINLKASGHGLFEDILVLATQMLIFSNLQIVMLTYLLTYYCYYKLQIFQNTLTFKIIINTHLPIPLQNGYGKSQK
jgi:hypothetical protein